MKKFDFKKIFLYFNYKNYDGTKIKLYRDWKVLILLFVLLLIVVFLIDLYIFFDFKKKIDVEIDISGEERINVVNKTALKDALDEIKKRNAQFQNNLERSAIPDPSL